MEEREEVVEVEDTETISHVIVPQAPGALAAEGNTQDSGCGCIQGP